MLYTQELRPRLDYMDTTARSAVLAALEVATVAHEGQKRKSGEPFIIHPVAVAAILADLRMDMDSVIAGLLHDTVEDTQMTLEELEDMFGRDVRRIVEGATKFSILATKVHGEATAADASTSNSSRCTVRTPNGATGMDSATNGHVARSEPRSRWTNGKHDSSLRDTESIDGSQSDSRTNGAHDMNHSTSNGDVNGHRRANGATHAHGANGAHPNGTGHNSNGKNGTKAQNGANGKNGTHRPVEVDFPNAQGHATEVKLSQKKSPKSMTSEQSPQALDPNGRKPHPESISSKASGVDTLVSQCEQDQAKREAERDKQADNLRSMFLAMTEDVRVILVKLADRLHNMRTLEHMKSAKQKKIAKETIEFFAPLAHRLGMRRIKAELEELSFRYLHPEAYRNLRLEVEALKRRGRFAHHMSCAVNTARDILQNDAILHNMTRSVRVEGCTKELYSIFRRISKGETMSSMLDIASLRVIVDLDPSVDSNQACYHVLGRLHALWTPLPKRLKDYIAFPKPNGYQSLHTTVLLDQSQSFFPMEIQIRTAAMHRIAEEGIVAELFQPDSRAEFPPRPGTQKSRLRQTDTPGNPPLTNGGRMDDEWGRRTKGWLMSIREYIEEFSSSRDLVDAVRRDILGNRVFVFTPKGRIVDLPKDSTPIDLAYAIHSDVGHTTMGAKINGRMVSLDYKLQNADVVKIMTSSSSSGPTEEWMTYAKSRTARQKIRQFLRARERDNMIERGSSILADAARRALEPEPSEQGLVEIMPRLSAVLSSFPELRHIRSVDEVLIAVSRGVKGSGNLSLIETVLTLLRVRRRSTGSTDEAAEALAEMQHGVPPRDSEEVPAEAVIGPQEDECVKVDAPPNEYVELATCCHPLHGDQIMGLRMHGDHSGVVVHRLQCSHMLRELRENPASPRVVGVQWTDHVASWDDHAAGRKGHLPLTSKDEHMAASHAGRPCQPGRIAITARDCDGLLSYVTGIVAGMGKSIRRASTETDPDTLIATLAFEVMVENTAELNKIIERLRECDEVSHVRRVGPNEGREFFPSTIRARNATHPAPRNRVSKGQACLIEVVDDRSAPSSDADAEPKPLATSRNRTKRQSAGGASHDGADGFESDG